MQQIKPTRSELLKTKKRIKLAKKGHELLKKKQDSLVMEFFKLLKEVKGQRGTLQENYSHASRMMREARALESDLTIKAAGLAVRQKAPIKLSVKNIAGVKIPQISRITPENTAPVYDSMMIQDVGFLYRRIVDDIILLAAKETALRKILVEIKKTKRRAYALEKILIPQLQAAVQHVQLELEERAREEFTRLKRMKK